MIVGYARVSTHGQELDAQIEALRAAGVQARIFQEKISGARSDRPELEAALHMLRKGDVLLVTRLDRLARSTLDLLHIIKRLESIGAGFKSLADPWADTTTAHGRLILTVLGGIAEFERELIRVRTGEGRKRAKANGQKFGHPFKLSLENCAAIKRARDHGDSITAIAKAYGVHRKTIVRAIERVV